MDEAGWLDSSDPEGMIRHLATVRACDARTMRLFVCACCRHALGRATSRPQRQALSTGERFARGKLREIDLDHAAEALSGLPGGGDAGDELARVAVAREDGPASALDVIDRLLDRSRRREEDRGTMCQVLRCLFRNPFRPSPPFDPAWAALTDGAARRVAERIDSRKTFGEMPILADALEDAGCTDAELVAHLRGAGPHFLGCWAVHAVLSARTRAA